MMVVDGHAIFADCVALALCVHGHETSEVTSGPITLRRVLDAAKRFAPQLVLLDLQLGHDSAECVDLTAALARRNIRVLLLATDDQPAQLLACLEAGAAGAFDKSGALDDLIHLIEDTAGSNTSTSIPAREGLFSSSPDPGTATAGRPEAFDNLTRSEGEVLVGLIDGLSSHRLAVERGVSVATVRSQIRAILLKLDVHSQLAAVALARQADWPHSIASSLIPRG